MSRQDHREHDRALELAASAIDFRLTVAQSAALDAHLMTCPACARSAAAMRADATALMPRATPLPSRRVDDAVAAAIAGRRPASPSLLVLVAVALLLVALLGVATAAGSILLRAWRPPINELPPAPAVVVEASPSAGVSATAIPIATATPLATASAPAPLVALDPGAATWVSLGPIQLLGGLKDPTLGSIVGFDGGYVGLGGADTVGPVAWFSTDGVTWSPALLAKQVVNCPDWGPPGNDMVNDAEARAIATNGRELVIVGEVVQRDSTPCGTLRAVAWHSSDGRTWVRSALFDEAASDTRAVAVWPSSGGWQAVSHDAVWTSSDGLDWSRKGDLPGALGGDQTAISGAPATGVPTAGILASLILDPQAGGATALFASPTGEAWRRLEGDGGCPLTTRILPPANLAAWVLVGDMRVCASGDLSDWTSTPLDAWLGAAAQTRYGAVVVGDACHGAGSTCKPAPRAWASADGRTWARLPNPPASTGPTLADGPAGVLFVGSTPSNPTPGAWRLSP
jgi:hypothetical protein